MSPDKSIAAKLQLHYAVQFIGAVGFNIGTPQPDESQMAFEWEPDQKLFVGKPIATSNPFRVAINPLSLEMLILNSNDLQTTAKFALVGNTKAAGLTWLRSQVADRGADVEQVDWINYERGDFPDHAIAHGAAFEPGFESELQQLVNYYELSNTILQKIVQADQYASAVNIWPHHFDLATLISFPDRGDGESKSIGVGMSPGDDSFEQPYWYITPNPVPVSVTFPELPRRGFWHTKEWIGAVLTTSRLDPDQDLSQQGQQIEEFLTQGLEISRGLLGED
jgi:hypothetical protein